MQPTASPSPVEVPADSRGAMAYNLAGIATLVLLLAVGAAYLVDALGQKDHAIVPSLADGEPITQTLGGTELSIPTRWFRYGEQIQDGFTSQIDLRVMMQAGGKPVPVNVTLLPRSRARTSSALLGQVYLHQFGDETLTGAPGLVGKPMLIGDGYANESVWYDALSPDPFVAKCMKGVDGTGAQCVRTVYLPSGIAAVYTFDEGLLANWRQFDAEMSRWLNRIGA